MRLYLLRHSQPLVAQGVCYGSTDLDVDDTEVAQLLQQVAPRCPDDAVLFSSPMRRCTKLAQPLADILGLRLQIDARLVEMDFGRWEMQNWDQIARAEIDAWANDVANYPVGGAASARHMAQRVAAFYDELQLSKQDAIVVSHAGTIRMLMARHAGYLPLHMATANMNTQVAYGGLVMIERDNIKEQQ